VSAVEVQGMCHTRKSKTPKYLNRYINGCSSSDAQYQEKTGQQTERRFFEAQAALKNFVSNTQDQPFHQNENQDAIDV
jgi:hypothetical protein